MLTPKVKWLESGVLGYPAQTGLRWLGGDPCSTPPENLSKDDLLRYAEQCGKQQAADYVYATTGVDVASCTNAKSATDFGNCVTQGYGVSLDVVRDDGTVDWKIVAQDAGAVAGVAVCATLGAEDPATLSWCGKVGGEVLSAVYSALDSVFSSFSTSKIDYSKCSVFAPMWPSSGIYMLREMLHPRAMPLPPSGDVTSWQDRDAKLQYDIAAQKLLIPRQIYVERLAKLKALSRATAVLIGNLSAKTGLSIKDVATKLRTAAPPGWSALLRPDVDTSIGVFDQNYAGQRLVSIGALADSWWQLNVFASNPIIRPSQYDTVAWWNSNSSVDPSGRPQADDVYRLFVTHVSGCSYQADWYFLGNFAQYSAKVAEIHNTPQSVVGSNRFIYYRTPKQIDVMLDSTKMSAAAFDFSVAVWSASLTRDLSEAFPVLNNIQRLKVMPRTTTSSSGGGSDDNTGLLIGAAVVAALGFFFLSGKSYSATRR